MAMTPKDVVSFAKENKTAMVDIKFTDFPGTWQHWTCPVSQFSEEVFERGFAFDGSSIRGWQPINASDMAMIPDPSTARMDPFNKLPTLSLIADIVDPITKQPYSRDPRYVAKKAEAYVKSTGIGDTIYFGPEAEFFIFDTVRFDSTQNSSFFHVDSSEGRWNSGKEILPDGSKNLGYLPNYKGGYYPVSPNDTLGDLRAEICIELEKLGLSVEAQHHEVATGGQCEIDFRFSTLTATADNLMWFKYVVKNVARRYGKTATFMPKPLFGDNGSGMHCHQSIWKGDKPLFAGDKTGGLSEMGIHYIGGILKHAKAIAAFTNPTTNSYRRLVPGYEAPVNLAYSARNRSAAIRIPIVNSPKQRRIEVRFPDPSANPYLAFAVMLMAGIDGVQNRLDPGEPLDKNIYHLSPEEAKNVPQMPGSLTEALSSLEQDNAFMMKGDVFTEDVISTWIDYKVENEVDPVRLRPVPQEFALYFDI
ncbi:MAG: type I glutamate--ammonia ligase [Deltaproteobacteria bacterium]|nr:MAG: type I glutamate--ammonia ligase [Deltaproteobacteria bacterium]